MSDRIPTFADLCSAIAEGRLATTVEGSMYLVNVRELRRFLEKLRSLPSISSPNVQALMHCDSEECSAPVGLIGR